MKLAKIPILFSASALLSPAVAAQMVDVYDPVPLCFRCIQGTVWLDDDGDGVRDLQEPGLPGWTVELRNAMNMVVATRTTDVLGKYRYPVVSSGVWRVRVQPRSTSWVQTAPLTVFHEVVLPTLPLAPQVRRDFGFTLPCQFPTIEFWVAGDSDNFLYEGDLDGTNVPPGSALETLLLSCNQNPYFDAPQADTCFGHAFEGIVPPGCYCTSARLWITIDPTGPDPNTDSISLLQEGLGVWGRLIYDLEPPNGPYHSGQPTTLVLDLANLPVSASGVTNVLPLLNDGVLEVFVADDTSVDSMLLEVGWCCQK
jgi:hypothetical protein